MALHLDPPGAKPVRETRKVRVADIREEDRIAHHGVQRIAHGALVCPECGLPVVIEDRVSAGSVLRCGFCDHGAPAREFVARDVFDTVANEVYLIARTT